MRDPRQSTRRSSIRQSLRKVSVHDKLQAQRTAVEYQLVTTEDDDEDYNDELSWGQQVLESHTFMNVMSAIIIMNGIVIGLEIDVKSFKYWTVVEAVFMCIFLAELIFKMWVEGCLFFHPHEQDFLWNVFDLLIVGLGVFDLISSIFGLSSSSGGFATIFRMARLLRVLRIIRLLKVLKPLFLLAVGLVEACKAILWVTLLMGTVLYMFAIVLVKTVGQVPPTDPHYDFLNGHFRTIGDCMITLFVLMSSPNLPTYQDEEGLLDSRPLLCVFLIMFICFGSFGMIAMLTGVINESMFENNEMRKHEKYLEHEAMRKELGGHAADLYETLPFDGEGRAKVDDLKNITEAAAELLDQAGITIAHGDIARFLELMDENESGYIDMIEFVHAVEKMAEGQSALAIVEVQHYAKLCNRKLSEQLENMTSLQEKSEQQIEKTEEEVNRILKVIADEQNEHRGHLMEKMEAQMLHITDEVDRILGAILDSHQDNLGDLVKRIESQMQHTSQEVDRILRVVSGDQGKISKPSPGLTDLEDRAPDIQILPEIRRSEATVLAALSKQDSKIIEKIESQMQHTAQEVDRMLRVVSGDEGKISKTSPGSPAFEDLASDIQISSEIRRSEATVPAALSKQDSKLIEKIESKMQHTAQEVDRILKVVSGDEGRIPKPSPGWPAMEDLARDIQILSEIRRSEATVLAALSKQDSKPTDQADTSVKTLIEKRFSDFERQLAVKDSSDKCLQLAASSQLQDISGSLHKMFRDAPDANTKEDAMEGLRSDLARLMQESKNSFVRVAKAHDTAKEGMEVLASKVSMLERGADNFQMQMLSRAAGLAGDISSLSDLLSTSFQRLHQDLAVPQPDIYRLQSRFPRSR